MKTIIEHLPWLLSAITVTTMWLAGSGWRYTWLVSLANQALWLIWILKTSSFGFLPMNIAMWIVAGRNHLKWSNKVKPVTKYSDEQLLELADHHLRETDAASALNAQLPKGPHGHGCKCKTGHVVGWDIGDTEVTCSVLPIPWAYNLWKHMADTHKLTLLESEIQDIIELATPLVNKNTPCIFKDGHQWSEWRTGDPDTQWRTCLHLDCQFKQRQKLC